MQKISNSGAASRASKRPECRSSRAHDAASRGMAGSTPSSFRNVVLTFGCLELALCRRSVRPRYGWFKDELISA
jgi:hypothetical protein